MTFATGSETHLSSQAGGTLVAGKGAFFPATFFKQPEGNEMHDILAERAAIDLAGYQQDSEIMKLTREFREAEERIRIATNKVADLADRLFGVVPETPSTVGPMPVVNGAISQANFAATEVRLSLERLEQAVSRLNGLA